MAEINWEGLEYFSQGEFDHPDEMSPLLLRLLDAARSMAGVAFVINSDFRTSEENEAVGGSKNSAHLRGLAVDIGCLSSGARYKMLKAIYRVGFVRIGEGSNFIHVDVDMTLPQDRHWRYD